MTEGRSSSLTLFLHAMAARERESEREREGRGGGGRFIQSKLDEVDAEHSIENTFYDAERDRATPTYQPTG